jgi:hypothetical protein
VFAAAFAAIHWAEYLAERREIVSPLVNSAPLVLLLIVSALRAPEVRRGAEIKAPPSP